MSGIGTMNYETPRIESTEEVEALLTWGAKSWGKDKGPKGGGSGHHS